MRMSAWWEHDETERFWVEVTDRRDIGADLNAPAASESGGQVASYELLKAPAEGDVVFHYSKPEGSLVGYSFVVGKPWEDTVSIPAFPYTQSGVFVHLAD